ncbi:hypothetical protein RBTH_05250 [Bacillus thuringiensis serovar israelensis ATCC 35646]|nr:hypothetical protein RBTH_05250 [Bacillus thuringiensis serovar israelensis ATCC 35646]
MNSSLQHDTTERGVFYYQIEQRRYLSGELMSKKLVKPILNGILFLGVFLFAHTYLKNVSFTRYLLVVIPMLLVGIFGIDLILSLLIKKEE